ncbi:hypothetical protein ABZ252_26280 [Streptomyces sp. NPDC006175]|uniref:hypothetical protein n=1 Tax=unclassified Streptomyces TaxID=2593676 RepID=UPI0033BC8A8D
MPTASIHGPFLGPESADDVKATPDAVKGAGSGATVHHDVIEPVPVEVGDVPVIVAEDLAKATVSASRSLTTSLILMSVSPPGLTDSAPVKPWPDLSERFADRPVHWR